MTDYDSPWKEVLDDYFPSFLAFFFPDVYNLVDWSRPYESLDTELQQVVSDAEFGPRRVDKLYKVWRLNGEESLVFIHSEIQNQEDAGFPERMFVYHYRLFDRFAQQVISLAVLGDENPSWRPNRFSYEECGCSLAFQYPIVKLLDYAMGLEALEGDSNPFAVVVRAHLKTKETSGDFESRRAWKLRIVRGLYSSGLGGNDVRRLFRFIDWLMELPEELERAFWNDVQLIEEEKKMPFVTIGERIGREEGLRSGLLSGVETSLRVKFGLVGMSLMDDIRALPGVDSLRAVLSAIETATQLDDLRQVIRSAQAGSV